MPEQLYVDVHVLQTVPPSNLNRDDAGAPKQATYGGTRRARVSSQAWKRATRKAFASSVDDSLLGTRTRRVTGLIAARLHARTGLATDDALRVVTALLADSLKISVGKKATETAYLLFLGNTQIERIVDLVADDAAALSGLTADELATALKERGPRVAETLRSGHPIDVALFGRMVADLQGLNVDAATQVAHALSTHAVDTEFDYFTAVDDQNAAEESGAGMIGNIEFNSATLYRYATVAVHQLLPNLDGDLKAARDALRLFLTCFVESMPTGHVTSFGHRTTPALVVFVLRADQPVNLVSAFEASVPSNAAAGYAAESVRRLAAELTAVESLWGHTPVGVYATYSPTPDPGTTAGFGPAHPFAESVALTVEAAMRFTTTTTTGPVTAAAVAAAAAVPA